MNACIKSIPDDEPNATGIFVAVKVDKARLKLPRGAPDMWEYLSSLLPAGNHAVSYTEDMRFAGKPGNWSP